MTITSDYYELLADAYLAEARRQEEALRAFVVEWLPGPLERLVDHPRLLKLYLRLPHRSVPTMVRKAGSLDWTVQLTPKRRVVDPTGARHSHVAGIGDYDGPRHTQRGRTPREDGRHPESAAPGGAAGPGRRRGVGSDAGEPSEHVSPHRVQMSGKDQRDN